MDVICYSDISWDFLWQRHQQLLTRFPKDWNIFYVEPSFIATMMRRPLHIFPYKVKDNITIVSLPSLPFLDRSARLRKINDHLLAISAAIFARVYRLKDLAVIIYEPRFSSVVGRLHERLVCYEIVDDRMEFTEVPRWIKTDIDFLIDKADIITVSSDHLYQIVAKKRKTGLFLIGNGVDIDHFRKTKDRHALPEELQKIKGPVLGYAGAVGEWFDMGLLEDILQKCPGISVVIVGPVFPANRQLMAQLADKYSNLHALGKKPYETLPYYMGAFDTCMIPFKVNALTKSVNPNKLYEYLACEKPVVSTALDELKKYGDIIYIANNNDEFVEHVKRSFISARDPADLLNVARANTWESKAAELVSIIEEKAGARMIK